MIAFQPYFTQNFMATAQIGPFCGGEKCPFARRQQYERCFTMNTFYATAIRPPDHMCWKTALQELGDFYTAENSFVNNKPGLAQS